MICYNDGMLLIHYTDKRNLAAIRESGVLKCALSLMTSGEAEELACVPRPQDKPVSCGAILRDQKPLLKVAPPPERVKYLNGFVFFWTDTVKGDSARCRFRIKYRHPAHVGLRCWLGDLGADVLYALGNSGTREDWVRFRRVESHEEGMAVEAVVQGQVQLPCNTQVECEDGKWRPFFPSR